MSWESIELGSVVLESIGLGINCVGYMLSWESIGSGFS